MKALPSIPEKTMNARRMPARWNEKRIQRVLRHYESQSDEEAAAEDEAAYKDVRTTHMLVPVELVPEIRRLIAARAAKRKD